MRKAPNWILPKRASKPLLIVDGHSKGMNKKNKTDLIEEKKVIN